jgi:hypothetical protein
MPERQSAFSRQFCDESTAAKFPLLVTENSKSDAKGEVIKVTI